MVDDGSKLRLCCVFPYFCLLVVLLFAAVTNGLPNGMARALICWSTCLLFIFRLNLLVANGRSEGDATTLSL